MILCRSIIMMQSLHNLVKVNCVLYHDIPIVISDFH